MQIVVVTLMVLAALCFLLKQTFLSWWSVAVNTLFAAALAVLSWPVAIQQSKTQISDWLANTSLMADTAVLLTVEVALHIVFCMQKVMPEQKKSNFFQKMTAKVIEYFPGLLFFAVVFCGLVMLIFTFTGVPFQRVAWLYALSLVLFLPAVVFFFKKIIPDKESRLELLFMLNVFMAALGIVATVNGRTSVVGTDNLNVGSLLAVLSVVMLGAVLGIMLHKIKKYRK